MSRPKPWPPEVHQALLRYERLQTMFYRARLAVGNALVDCFNEGRPWSHINQKPKEVRA